MKRALLSLLLMCSLARADVTTTHNRNSFACNGATTEFAFTFDVMGGDTSDIIVVLRDSDGDDTVLTETAHYTVSATNNDYRAGPGGTVTTVETYASGYTLVVYRSEDATNSASLKSGSRLDTVALQNEIDKLYLLIQDLQEQLNRTPKFPVADSTALTVDYSNSASRASSYPYFGDDGSMTTTSSVASDNTVVSAFMETVVDDPNGAVALATLLADADGETVLTTMGGIHVNNVKTYGATGDGETDDTMAIATALAAGSNIADWDSYDSDSKKAVYFPPGIYKVTSQLEVLDTTLLFGSGAASQIFYSSAGSGGICLNIDDSEAITIRDIHISCDTENETDNTGINVDHGSSLLMQNVMISDFRDGYGLVLDETYRSSYVNLNIARCGTGIKMGSDADNTWVNVATFVGGHVRQSGMNSDVADGADAGKYTYLRDEAAVVIEKGQRISFIGHTIEGSRSAAYLVKTGKQITFDSCHMEANCKFLKSTEDETVALANDHSMFEIFLNAIDSSNPFGDDMAITNVRIINCKLSNKGIRAQASSTNRISNLTIQHCDVTPTLQDDYGWVYGINYINNIDNNSDPDTETDLEPDVIVTDDDGNEFSASSTWANDPYLFHRVGERVVTAVNHRYTIQASTGDLVYAAAATSSARTYKCYLDNAMSAAEMMSVIEHYGPFIPAPITVVAYFEDGDYTQAAAIDLYEYYGSGNLQILGNTGESGLHTDQAVALDASAPNAGIRFFECDIRINVDNLKITAATTPLYFRNCGDVDINGCYLIGEAAGAGDGIRFFNTDGRAEDNYVSTIQYGIEADENSRVISDNNDDTGTKPDYGLRVDNNAVIGKVGTQPTGTTGDESGSGSNGGIIR